MSLRHMLLPSILILFHALSAFAQGTAISYQGKLTDAGNPANGPFDMQFELFDTPTVGTGTQQGATITLPMVQVSAGIFTVALDFGAPVFDGTLRYLEIAVRPAGSPNPHTTLAPRQPITSSPYAIQTIDAKQLGGLPASRYVATDASGRVGIGITPSHRLDVVGSIRATGSDSNDVIAETTGGTNAWARMTMRTLGQHWSLGTSRNFNADQLYVYDFTHDQLRLTIQPNGGPVAFPNYTSGGRVLIGDAGCGTGTGFGAVGFAPTLAGCTNYALLGNGANTFLNREAGGGIFFREANADQVTIAAGGNVGVGTAMPDSKLTIVGAGANGFSVGVSGNVGIGGNAVQVRDKGGWPKAMVYVNGDGTLLRCYNGTTGTSTLGTCGFTASRINMSSSGWYLVTFGFAVNDRFWSATADSASGVNVTVTQGIFSALSTQLEVYVTNSNDDTVDRPFMLFVY